MSKRHLTSPHAAGPKPGKKARRAAAQRAAAENATPIENPTAAENFACIEASAAVFSDANTDPAAGIPPAAPAGGSPARSTSMEQTITLTLNEAPRKSERLIFYTGGHIHTVQFLKTAFPEGVPPKTLTITGNFAEVPAPKVPRAKETPEERKARLAAMPKLTLAEKVAKAEKRAQELREKLAKKAAAEAPAA